MNEISYLTLNKLNTVLLQTYTLYHYTLCRPSMKKMVFRNRSIHPKCFKLLTMISMNQHEPIV